MPPHSTVVVERTAVTSGTSGRVSRLLLSFLRCSSIEERGHVATWHVVEINGTAATTRVNALCVIVQTLNRASIKCNNKLMMMLTEEKGRKQERKKGRTKKKNQVESFPNSYRKNFP